MILTAIVPTLDEARVLEGTLADLQAAGVDRIVVSDGGSKDGTTDIARAYGAQVVHGRPGRALQLNRGAQRATGDVLWFVHADVRVPPDARTRIEHALQDPHVVGGAFGTRTRADVRHPLTPFLPLADFRSRYTRLPYGDQALFVRRPVFETVGGYPLQPLFEDVELARRLWTCGEVVRVPSEVRVSGRRFLSRPVYYTTVMWTFPLLYRLGVPTDRLASAYGSVR